ncbi:MULTISPECIES: hypothetical protein [Mycobacteriaceae]|uniref:Proline rich protein n=1 Tax=Mycolicibacterium neoaurum VKM Ac-1815D TaxID=700508 RepID=V5X906_MYCNE|nr:MULTISPECIES: hypothetical protein [Mycobacteriaceae]AHC24487.1 hypothetical protein D174_07765 [Mycolicibacterium neoaurum VKM Ac-1815D]KJQ52166.1 hypothetical protein TS71_05880 [Mycolicibacterium neoaurum]KUM07797.1 hypothetical protein AVZ31_14555 [Mycolicibacterium neoaurum]
MTDTPEPSNASTTAAPAVTATTNRLDHAERRPNRLYQSLAWVGIVTGVLFVVMVIFGAGFFAGAATGGYHGWTRGYHSAQMGQNGPSGGCPMMGPGMTMGPGPMMGPGGMPPQRQAPSMMPTLPQRP